MMCKKYLDNYIASLVVFAVIIIMSHGIYASDNDTISQGLYLEVKPEDSNIQINDTSYSKGPLSIFLPSGKFILKVSKDGYFSYSDTIEVELGKVTTKKVVLHQVKLFLSPSGATISNTSGMGGLFSFRFGVLEDRKNSLGLLFDFGMMFMTDITLYDLSLYYSRSFYLNNSISVSPFISGGAILIQDPIVDSLRSDTISKSMAILHDYNYDTTYTNSYGFSMQIGTDVNIKKNEKWGFFISPSVLWTERFKYQLIMRFGVVIWIL